MYRRSLLVCALLAGLSISACGFDARTQAIQAAVTKFFETFSVPGPDTQPVWGMSEFRIIGMGANWAIAEAEITPIGGAEDACAVALQLWCKGKSLTGEPLKLRRTLHLKALTDDNGATWRIESPEFREDQPLTFLRQLLWWLFGTFVILPGVFMIGLGLMSASDKVGCLAGLFNWGAAFGVFVAPALMPAFFADAFLDSVVFTGICLVVSILITIGIYKALP